MSTPGKSDADRPRGHVVTEIQNQLIADNNLLNARTGQCRHNDRTAGSLNAARTERTVPSP